MEISSDVGIIIYIIVNMKLYSWSRMIFRILYGPMIISDYRCFSFQFFYYLQIYDHRYV